MIIISKRRIEYYSLLLIIFNYAIALKIGIIRNGINIILIALFIVVIIFNLDLLFKIHKRNIFLYLIPFTFLIPLHNSINKFQITSFLYSLMFLAIFNITISILQKNTLKINNYKNILKIILNLYIIVAITQFILFQFNIYFNKIWSGSLDRINSLATEPSYAGMIFIITLYSYLLINNLQNKGRYTIKYFLKDIYLWIATIFLVIVTNSSYAFIFLIILILSLIKRKYIFQLPLILLLLLFILQTNISATERVTDIIQAFFSFNIYNLVEADHSGSIRVAPIILFARDFDLFSINTWLGNGYGYAKMYLGSIIPGINIEEWEGGGFFPGYIYNYGLLAFIIVFIFIKQNTLPKLFSIELLFLFPLLLNSSFNTQVFWYTITIFTINKLFIFNEKNNLFSHTK